MRHRHARPRDEDQRAQEVLRPVVVGARVQVQPLAEHALPAGLHRVDRLHGERVERRAIAQREPLAVA